MVGSLAGAKKPKAPPPAALPAAGVQDARAETGADIILGGERSVTGDPKKKKASTAAAKKTGSTGVAVGSAQAGLNIL